MINIPMFGGIVAHVDECDVELVMGFKWHAQPKSRTAYAISKADGRTIRMHRLIMKSTESQIVDHIDGNGLNNVRANLRHVTPTQNMMNSAGWRNRSLKSKGVYASNGRFYSTIKVAGTPTLLGYFDTEEEGAEAYRVAVRKYYGEYARIT